MLDSDPRHYSYLPMLGPVVATGDLFGFILAVVTVVVTMLAADVFLVAPQSTFAFTNWEDIAGLAVFATLGAGVALTIDDFLNVGSA